MKTIKDIYSLLRNDYFVVKFPDKTISIERFIKIQRDKEREDIECKTIFTNSDGIKHWLDSKDNDKGNVGFYRINDTSLKFYSIKEKEIKDTILIESL